MTTLYGIFNAQRALSLNQSVMNVINNNIANINTPGYSKQRAELEQLTSGNLSNIPQVQAENSIGSIISAITRNRDIFLDNYYRNENTDLSYYKELDSNANFIENITNELDQTGINNSLQTFYQALTQLSSNPSDLVARNNVVQGAIQLTTTFKSTFKQLKDLRTNLVGDPARPDTLANSKINTTVAELNTKLGAIANLNNSIILSTQQGTSPNYLLDQRDTLLDEVSQYIPLTITPQTNGAVNITTGNTALISGDSQLGFFNVVQGDENNPAILQVENATGGILVADASSLMTSGQIGAILQMGGSDTNELTIKGVMDSLDTLAQGIATDINALQTGGQFIDGDADPKVLVSTYDDDGDPGTPEVPPPAFFTGDLLSGITAENISVNSAIIDDPYKISAASAAASPTETGDGSNALLMAQLRNSAVTGLGGATTEQFVTNLVGKAGSQATTIKDNYDIKDSIISQLTLKRDSVTGVNLDEEMTDLIKFQRAYEASAKVFSAVSDSIKTIINMVQ